MQTHLANRMDGLNGSAIREIFKLLGDPSIISFAGGNPSVKSFPSKEMADLSAQLLQEKGDVLLQYGTTEGYAPLRESILSVLEERSIQTTTDHIITLTGSSQGIELFTKILINPGDVILCESPTFLGALQTFASYQAKVIGVPMDQDGMDVVQLEKDIQAYHPKFIYTIPTFQNPTGAKLSLARRQKIAELAEKYDVYILEDDPYGSLRYEGEPLPSIKSFDTTGHVMHLISFSKTVSPGLRVGAAVGDPALLRPMTVAKQGMDTHTNNLAQAMVDAYIRSCRYFEHVKEIIPAYREQLHTMLDGFRFFPDSCTHTVPQGGLFVWAELPEGVDTLPLLEKAVARKVAYIPGTHFYPDGGHANTLRLNFSACEPARITQGMQILGDLLKETLK